MHTQCMVRFKNFLHTDFKQTLQLFIKNRFKNKQLFKYTNFLYIIINLEIPYLKLFKII